jgi:hypothetical protein
MPSPSCWKESHPSQRPSLGSLRCGKSLKRAAEVEERTSSRQGSGLFSTLPCVSVIRCDKCILCLAAHQQANPSSYRYAFEVSQTTRAHVYVLRNVGTGLKRDPNLEVDLAALASTDSESYVIPSTYLCHQRVRILIQELTTKLSLAPSSRYYLVTVLPNHTAHAYGLLRPLDCCGDRDKSEGE